MGFFFFVLLSLGSQMGIKMAVNYFDLYDLV